MREVPVETVLAGAVSVACARFTRDGVLRHANRRFLDVSSAREGESQLADLVVEGQRDQIARLLHSDETSGTLANVHFASPAAAPTTMLVNWVRDDDELILVGEPPMAELEATQATLLKLNSRVSDLARENAKKSAQLERALADLRDAQAMLVHREKMAALGQMTAGVAHELNNPLAYVRNDLFLLDQSIRALLTLVNLFGEDLDTIEASEPALFEKVLDGIETVDLPRLADQIPRLFASLAGGIDRAAGLVNSLRTFSRLDEAEVKTVDLNASLRSVAEFAGFLLTETGTTLSMNLGPLPPVTCSPGQLNQAVLNIVTNAIQASAPGDQVELSSGHDGDGVWIRIADHGPGVAAAIAGRIFEPFFTTRPVGEGTGLGLSIAHTVVAAHDGSVMLDETPGGGATFTIRIPTNPQVDAVDPAPVDAGMPDMGQ